MGNESEHDKLNNGLEWMFDFTKLHKVSKNIDSNNPVIPVVVQDATTKEVLIIAYANDKALMHTIKTGNSTFWSTSRNELWEKGKTSGDVLKIKEIRVNCDQNSLLYLVAPVSEGACHVDDKNGKALRTCYYRRIKNIEVSDTKKEDTLTLTLEFLDNIDK